VNVDRRAGGPFGYLAIWAFDAEPEAFINELIRLIPLLPDRGLILDVRGNPGGYIWAAELALQLFTPHEIEPTRFSALATPFTREMAAAAASPRRWSRGARRSTRPCATVSCTRRPSRSRIRTRATRIGTALRRPPSCWSRLDDVLRG
jgi:hypothetical protein